MPKTYCFLTSIFWGFGLDFGRSWASKMEPSWEFWPKNFRDGGPCERSYVKCLFEIPSRGPPGWIMRPPASILKDSGYDFAIIFACLGLCTICKNFEKLTRSLRHRRHYVPSPTRNKRQLNSVTLLAVLRLTPFHQPLKAVPKSPTDAAASA